MSDAGIDVIVNNHNYGPFLRTAVDSALAQTHPRVRVVVVDDGSADDSRAIIESYGSRIIPVLKENAGQASAFNAGLHASTSDIVLFLDADDALRPDICARVAAAFTDHPEAARVQYRMEVIDQQGNPTGVMKPPEYVRLPWGTSDVMRLPSRSTYPGWRRAATLSTRGLCTGSHPFQRTTSVSSPTGTWSI